MEIVARIPDPTLHGLWPAGPAARVSRGQAAPKPRSD